MSAAFVLGKSQRSALQNLREYAEKHQIEVDEMLDIYNGRVKAVGDRPEFVCEIPVGYRVVFCIEFQKKGWARHMSVSHHPFRPNKSPHPAVIRELMVLLGFTAKLGSSNVVVYFENQNTIVNAIEYLE